MWRDRDLASRVEFVSLATLPVAQQVRLVSTSLGLAGVHGAALGLTAFLPSGPRARCSVLEIYPRRMNRQINHAWFDYPRWAVMNAVEHVVLSRQADQPGCEGIDFRECGNVSVDVPAVTEKLRWMLRHKIRLKRPSRVSTASARVSDSVHAVE